MDFNILTQLTKPRIKIKVSRQNKTESFAEDVLSGLTACRKTLSPKYFYDEIGSQLFEKISELPEYYPTRTERGIIARNISEIISFCCSKTELVELGSGSSTKTRLLIEAFLNKYHKLNYIPIDISRSILVESARYLQKRYPEIHITGLVSDYIKALNYLTRHHHDHKMIIFLGSSIGNFAPDESLSFLKKIRESLAPSDMLLLGMDMVKSEDILIPAYDDAQGVTAKFNLNILARINRELGGRFDLNKFQHKAIFNKDQSRIEMHLVSAQKQTVEVDYFHRQFRFDKGETIHTENSHKYSESNILRMAELTGFEVENSWYDEKKWFSLNLLKPL